MRYRVVLISVKLKYRIMKRLNVTTAILLILGFGLLFHSCKKDEVEPYQSTSFSDDDALAESIYGDVTSIADEAYDLGSRGFKSGGGNNSFISECVTITLDLTVFPYTLTVDFGEENCLCNDGRYRRGKIVVSFNGAYHKPGTVITTSFENFHVNNHKIEGTSTISNMGFNADSNMYYSVEIVGVIYLAGDAGTITWNSSREREWIEGRTTWVAEDDVYLITGTADGVRPNGQTWEKEITSAFRVELDCRWIVSGTMEIRPEGLPIRVLDFGDGECDNIATVLIDGVLYTIHLP